MSSFIGHGLSALCIGRALAPADDVKRPLWQTWLVIAAILPDIDYILRPLNSANNNGVRITHSIAFSLVLAIFGVFHLFLFDPKNLVRGSIQSFLAGFSHLLLDTLVGSRQGDPWFYPISPDAYSLPLGILPSSAKISLTNYYLYRNLLIECGILVPAFLLILHFTGKLQLNRLVVFGLFVTLAGFLAWSVGLTR